LVEQKKHLHPGHYQGAFIPPEIDQRQVSLVVGQDRPRLQIVYDIPFPALQPCGDIGQYSGTPGKIFFYLLYGPSWNFCAVIL